MRRDFEGAGGVRLAADVTGDPQAPPVLLLHGGGQTRHSWGAAAAAIAERGYYAVSLDLRGHGDSAWAPDGDYEIGSFAADVRAVAADLGAPPVLVGESLGGLASVLALGESPGLARALVLADITLRPDPQGAARITAFMGAAPNGFASLDEAAAAVSAYLPHRKPPPSTAGLARSLRLRDGRYHWHWDPAFLHRTRPTPEAIAPRFDAAAARITVPTLLIQGGASEIVTEDAVADLMRLIPQTRRVLVPGAHHMVAGDDNDVFNAALLGFLDELPRT